MMRNPDGLDTAPWWVQLIFRLGFSASLAAGLTWFLVTNVTGSLITLSTNQQEILKQETIIIQNQGRIIELLGEHARTTMQTTLVLQALCHNMATTESERARCVDAFRR